METDSKAYQETLDNLSDMSAVVEEIEEDEGITLTLAKSRSPPGTTRFSPINQDSEDVSCMTTMPMSPVKVGGREREFGNISPISELLDGDDEEDEDIESVSSEDKDEDGGRSSSNKSPEPGSRSLRNSYPRISDGRSSPILAFSPSLIKSPSNSKSSLRKSSSPSSGGGGGGVAGKRPRNIARMLDNISDHSSGEDEVNNVGIMMAKFTV